MAMKTHAESAAHWSAEAIRMIALAVTADEAWIAENAIENARTFAARAARFAALGA